MNTSAVISSVKGVRPGPFLGLVVEPLDVSLELLLVDPPLPATPDLDRRKLAGAHERIGLGHAHVEVDRDVFELEETRLDSGGRLLGRGSPRAAHEAILASDRPEYVD